MQEGGLEAAISFYAENTTPQIIVLESREKGEPLLGQIDALAEHCEPGTNVIIVGEDNDIALYRALIRRGVTEYLPSPITPGQILEAIGTIMFDPEAPPMGRIIAFTGARGGAGSSTIAHNVAWALGQLYQEDVTLVDLDIAFGTAGLAFNLEAKEGIHTALADPGRLDDQLLEGFLAPYDEYVKLLVSPASLDMEETISVESLETLLELVRRNAPFVVLDVPHRWTAWTRQALVDADESVITATLDLASMRDCKSLVERLNAQRGEEASVRIVLNRAGAFKKTELAAKDFEQGIDAKPALVVPHDPALFGTAANNGQMVGEVNKRSKVVEGFRTLASTVSGRASATPKKTGKLSLFKAKGSKKGKT